MFPGRPPTVRLRYDSEQPGGHGYAVSVECALLRDPIPDGSRKRCLLSDADHGCRKYWFERQLGQWQCSRCSSGYDNGSSECNECRVHRDRVRGDDGAGRNLDSERWRRFQDLCDAAECFSGERPLIRHQHRHLGLRECDCEYVIDTTCGTHFHGHCAGDDQFSHIEVGQDSPCREPLSQLL